MNLSTEPARLMALVHALLTAAATTGVLLATDPRVAFAIAAAAITGDWLAGRVVRDRVSPAYSDGHPVTNLPPDGPLQDGLPWSLPAVYTLPSEAGPVRDVQPPPPEV